MAEPDRARELLLALIYPKTADDFSAAETTAFADAVAEQAEYLATYRGGIKSESLGEVSVTYNTEKSASFSFYGMPISPLAVSRLASAGLLSRWV